MCGIIGVLKPNSFCLAADWLQALSNRGPDANGSWLSPCGSTWFGHTRLAIQDLSPLGAQPMAHPNHNGLTITYNGEIYNYRS